MDKRTSILTLNIKVQGKKRRLGVDSGNWDKEHKKIHQSEIYFQKKKFVDSLQTWWWLH